MPYSGIAKISGSGIASSSVVRALPPPNCKLVVLVAGAEIVANLRGADITSIDLGTSSESDERLGKVLKTVSWLNVCTS